MDYKLMAKEILEHIGGAENIANMTHCATRLRLTLKDTSKANDEEVKSIEGVINVVNKAGQYQLLIGTEVPKLYDEFENLVKGTGNLEPNDNNTSSESVISKIFSSVSAIFAPLLPALAGSGILRGLLILCVQLGWISENSGTYTIIY
ncbi:pts system beta-glucoside-specific eiibca component, partial [Listeria ivanovii FSL F6-596]